jgi:DNA-binding XRE family transcriptional regulator
VFVARRVGNRADMPTVPRELPSQAHRSSERFTAEKKALGARLRALRQARQWTLDKAAEHTGVDWRHIQMVEVGDSNVTLLTLVRLAEGFEVPLSVFFVDLDS